MFFCGKCTLHTLHPYIFASIYRPMSAGVAECSLRASGTLSLERHVQLSGMRTALRPGDRDEKREGRHQAEGERQKQAGTIGGRSSSQELRPCRLAARAKKRIAYDPTFPSDHITRYTRWKMHDSDKRIVTLMREYNILLPVQLYVILRIFGTGAG